MEAWIDLIAAALAPAAAAAGGQGGALVVPEVHGQMPLLEQSLPTAWLHARAPWCTDFQAAAHRHPVCRQRLAWRSSAAEVPALIARMSLGVMSMPLSAQRCDAIAALISQLRPSAPWLLHGPSRAVGWRALSAAPQEGMAWQELPAPAGQRLLIGRPLADASLALGLATGYAAPLARRLVARLLRGRRLPAAAADVEEGDGPPRLRIRQPGVQALAVTSEPMLHQVLVQNRALVGPRGGAVLVLPWGGADRARLLLCNVRSRLDEVRLMVSEQVFAPQAVSYTDRGALVNLVLPAPPQGADALLHLVLPASAQPPDDFCELGLAEFGVGLTG